MYDVLFMFHLMIIEFMYLFWGQKINILFFFLLKLVDLCFLAGSGYATYDIVTICL